MGSKAFLEQFLPKRLQALVLCLQQSGSFPGVVCVMPNAPHQLFMQFVKTWKISENWLTPKKCWLVSSLVELLCKTESILLTLSCPGDLWYLTITMFLEQIRIRNRSNKVGRTESQPGHPQFLQVDVALTLTFFFFLRKILCLPRVGVHALLTETRINLCLWYLGFSYRLYLLLRFHSF